MSSIIQAPAFPAFSELETLPRGSSKLQRERFYGKILVLAAELWARRHAALDDARGTWMNVLSDCITN